MDLTVRALTQRPVDQVDFYFNGKSMAREEIEPNYLFQDDRNGIWDSVRERMGYHSATF